MIYVPLGIWNTKTQSEGKKVREVEHHPSNNPTDRLNNPSQFPVRRHRERVTSLANHATTKTTSLSDFGGAASGESNDGGGRRATDDRYLLLSFFLPKNASGPLRSVFLC